MHNDSKRGASGLKKLAGPESTNNARDGVKRRDFLNGMLIGASGIFLGGSSVLGCSDDPVAPALPKGNEKVQQYEICHQVRDGKMFDIPAPSGELYDCIIIGSGIAGLVSAWRLGKRGVTNMIILEKDGIGGMAQSTTDGPHTFAQAAAYTVYPYNDNLIEVYTDLGVVTGVDMDGAAILDPKYVVPEPANNVIMDGKIISDGWNVGLDKLPLPANVIADLKACTQDMRDWYDYVGMDGKFAFDTPTDASTTDPDVRALDNLTWLDYVKSKGWDPAVSEFWDPYIRSALGATHDTVSAWAMLNFMGSEFQPSMSEPGGNAYLAKALAAKVGESKIKTGATVIRATTQGMEVHVTYIENGQMTTIRAKTAICSAPLYIARHLIPDLAAAGRLEGKDFKYTPYIVAHAHVSKTPEKLAYDNWAHGDFFFTDIIVADWAALEDPAAASLDRPNVISIYTPLFGATARTDLQTKPFEEYEKLILDDLERLVPGIGKTITQFDIYRWGHAMLSATKGFMFSKSRLDSQLPIGLISFACHDVDGLPAFENAVGAAYRATDEVGAILGV